MNYKQYTKKDQMNLAEQEFFKKDFALFVDLYEKTVKRPSYKNHKMERKIRERGVKK